ncbi:MAG: hypothetical protein Q8M11_15065 [Sulfuritalea sp.]|nr:hypothetical protein [Sulfuritalea sp.]
MRFSISFLRSVIATKKLTGSYYPLRVRIGLGQCLRLNIDKGARTTLIGSLLVNSWGGKNIASSLSCANQSSLDIFGNFEIGPDVHIELAQGAKLSLGGKKNSSASGITCDSRIMVEDSLVIGCDCIIAWDVFISDSDWHDVAGTSRSSPVSIGDHVWISHGVSVLKGAEIPSGCIVGAKSLVASAFDTKNVLIAGVPAKVMKYEVEWSR